jgi:hypothetical protein
MTGKEHIDGNSQVHILGYRQPAVMATHWRDLIPSNTVVRDPLLVTALLTGTKCSNAKAKLYVLSIISQIAVGNWHRR